MDLNRSELIGNLTKDIELRSTKGGTNYVFFSIATNHTYKDASGELVKKVTFHDCVAWGKFAETIAKLGGKGKKVFVAGRMEKEMKENDAGFKYNVTRLLVSEFIMLSKGAHPTAPTDDEIESFADAEVRPAKKNQDDKYGTAGMTEEISIEDVPF